MTEEMHLSAREEPRRSEDDPELISLLGMVNVALRHLGVLLLVPIGFAVLGVLLVSTRPTEYQADSTIMPQTPDESTSGLVGLATQFGVDVGGSSGGESLDFYVRLARSREILRAVALSEYTVEPVEDASGPVEGTLVELYQPEGLTEQERIRTTIGLLGEEVTALADRQTGLIELRTSASSPDLAVQVNRRLIEFLNAFNLERRQSQARAEREFVQQRTEEAQTALVEAEEDFQRFLERHRRYEDSPSLVFEAGRLQRAITLRQQVYATLSQTYEQARINEVRSTPVITVIESPENSARRSSPPGTLLVALLALLTGAVFAVGIVIVREFLARQRAANPVQYSEFKYHQRRMFRPFQSRRVRQGRGD